MNIKSKIFWLQFSCTLFLHSQISRGKDLVAQLVEQYTFNVWALGSSPSGITSNTETALKIKDFRGFFFFRVNNGNKKHTLFLFYKLLLPVDNTDLLPYIMLYSVLSDT